MRMVSVNADRFLDRFSDSKDSDDLEFENHIPSWSALVQRLQERTEEKKWPSSLFDRLFSMRKSVTKRRPWTDEDARVASTLARLAIAHQARLSFRIVIAWWERSASFDHPAAFRQLSDLPVVDRKMSTLECLTVCIIRSKRPLAVYSIDLKTEQQIDGSLENRKRMALKALSSEWLPLLLDLECLARWPQSLCQLVLGYMPLPEWIPDGFKSSLDFESKLFHGYFYCRHRDTRACPAIHHHCTIASTLDRSILSAGGNTVEVNVHNFSPIYTFPMDRHIDTTARVSSGWLQVSHSNTDIPVWVVSFQNTSVPVLVRRFQPGKSAPFETPFLLEDIWRSLLSGVDPDGARQALSQPQDWRSGFQLYLHQLGERLLYAQALPDIVDVSAFTRMTLADFEALISED